MGNASINRFEWFKAVIQDGAVGSTAKVVAGALAVRFSNEETGQLNPSVATLAEYVKVSDDTVKRAVRALVDANWLARSEGRGRGCKTVYTLCSPGQIIAISDRKRGANLPCEKGGKPAPFAEEKGANLRRKGCKSEPSYIEQSSEQKARAGAERPSPQCRMCIKRGSDGERSWDAWLAANGYPSLSSLGIRSSDFESAGWDAPFAVPPQPDDRLETRIAEKWATWASCQMQERTCA